MIIEKVDVRGFGCLHERGFAFVPGLNVVFGANEVGKSTLLQAIQALLYGHFRDSGTWAGEVVRARFEPWSGGSYAGTLSVCLASGEQYRIERRFAPEHTTIYRDPGATDVTRSFGQGRHGWVTFADDRLGLSPAVFRASACIQQDELRLDRAEIRTLQARLETLADSGGVEASAQAALATLSQWTRDRLNPNAHSVENSPLQRAEATVRILTDRLEQSRSVLADLASLAADEQDSVARVEALRAELASTLAVSAWHEACALEAKLADLADINAKIAAAQIELAGLPRRDPAFDAQSCLAEAREAVSSAAIERDNLARATQKRADYPDNPRARADYETLQAQLTGLTAEKLAEVRAFATNVKVAEVRHGAKTASSGPLAAAVGVVIGLVVGYLVVGALGAVVSAVILGLLAYAVVTRGRVSVADDGLAKNQAILARQLAVYGVASIEDLQAAWDRRSERRAELSTAQSLAAAVEATREAYQNQLTRIETLLGVRDVDDASHLLEHFTSQLRALEVQGARRQTLVGSGDPSAWRTNAAAARARARPPAADDSRRLDDLRVVEERLRRAIETAQSYVIELRTRHEERLASIVDPAEIEEQLAAATSERDRLRYLNTILQGARDLIATVAEDYHRSFAPRLGELVSSRLARTTSDRYTRAEISPTDLAVRLESRERGGLIALDQVSGGTRDAVALLLRIGVVDVLSTSGEPVPLFLDDPLVHVDPERTRNLLAILREIARDRQIFYLTQDPRIVEWVEARGPGGVHHLAASPI